MTVPPIRNHGNNGHLGDHNNISDVLTTHNSYLDQGVKTTDTPNFIGVDFGQVVNTAGVINISNNLLSTIDSFLASSYRSAEYNLQLSQGNKYTVVKITVLHDGTNSGISEYGKVEMGGNISYLITSDVSGPNVLLSCQVFDGDVAPTTVKFFKTLINL